MTAFAGANPSATIGNLTDGRVFGLGDKLVQHDGKEYLFVQASAAITQYDVVYITSAYAAADITTTAGLRGFLVGVAPVAFASGDYGWVQVKGPCTMNVLASCAANVRLNTTGTAGFPDDDGTSTTKQIQGIYLTTARAASNGSAPGILNYPFVDVTL